MLTYETDLSGVDGVGAPRGSPLRLLLLCQTQVQATKSQYQWRLAPLRPGAGAPDRGRRACRRSRKQTSRTFGLAGCPPGWVPQISRKGRRGSGLVIARDWNHSVLRSKRTKPEFLL